MYTKWKESSEAVDADDDDDESSTEVSLSDGILLAKQKLNTLHSSLGARGFDEIFVDHFESDVTVVTRHNPLTHESIVLVARTAFAHPSHDTHNNVSRALVIPSRIDKILFEANVGKTSADADHNSHSSSSAAAASVIRGLRNYKLKLRELGSELAASDYIGRVDYNGESSCVHFKYFPPGTVLCLAVSLNESASDVLPFLHASIGKLRAAPKTSDLSNIDKIISSLSYDELNILLFRCSSEEASEQIGSNVYEVPGYGPLVYCGLVGFLNVLDKQRALNAKHLLREGEPEARAADPPSLFPARSPPAPRASSLLPSSHTC